MTDAVADFLSNQSYERRVVIFYDILDWRNHIKKAGNDLEKIGELRRLVLLHSRMLRLPTPVPVKREHVAYSAAFVSPCGAIRYAVARYASYIRRRTR